MAIDRIFMIDNTSVVQDEVLAHRVGLVPIYAEPSRFTDMPGVSILLYLLSTLR